MNLSSLFSINKDFINLNFFKTESIKIGMMNVVQKTTIIQTSALKNEILNIPDVKKISIIHVGNKTG